MRRSWAAPAGTVAERFPAMGCEVLVILPSERAAHADTVSALFAEWEARLSRFRPDSDLSRLNAVAGRPTWVREPLLGVLRRALRAARATRGVFDPTLARELSVLGYATTFSEVRGEVAAVPAPARASSWHEVRIGPGGLVSLPADLTVDLGGIAKGMAVDAALAALRAEGVPFALVSAGGDLGVLGGRSWPVAVEGGRRRDRRLAHGGSARDVEHGGAALAHRERRDAPPDRPPHAPAGDDRPRPRDGARPDLRDGRGRRQGRAHPGLGRRRSVPGTPPPHGAAQHRRCSC